MPLTLASFGDMFESSTPGIPEIKGKGKQGSSKVIVTKQGSRIDNHAQAVQRTSHNARGRR